MKFGKLEKSKVSDNKEQFERETIFTKWLATEGKNIISETLQLNFDGDGETEQRTYSNKRIDIKFKTLEDEIVIVESQFNKSDHDHLGKLISYASTDEKVKYVVWTVEEANEIHTRAIDMLNKVFESSDSHEMYFYLFESVMYKINDSFTVNLELKKGPEINSVQLNKIKVTEDTPLIIAQQNFWLDLKEYADSLDEDSTIINRYVATARKQHWSDFRFKNLETKIGYGSFTITNNNKPRVNLVLYKEKDSEKESLRLNKIYEIVKSELLKIYPNNEIGNNGFKIDKKTSAMYIEFDGDLRKPNDELFNQFLKARDELEIIIKNNKEIFIN